MQLKLWLVIALFLLIAWMGRHVYGRVTKSGGLVVATYNVRYNTASDGANAWPQRKERLVRELMSHGPAVIGMQEVLQGQLEELRALLPAHYQVVGVGRDDGASRGEYAPIWFDSSLFTLQQQGTFWLSEQPDRPSKGWDAALPRICTWVALTHKRTGREFWAFNTHLDHQGGLSRENSAALLAQMAGRVPNSPPVLIMGDFNSQPQEAPYRILEAEGWLDARATAEKRLGPIGTFPDFDGRRPEKRIDYLFYKNLPPPYLYEVDGPPDRQPPFASDHLPVLVHFPW